MANCACTTNTVQELLRKTGIRAPLNPAAMKIVWPRIDFSFSAVTGGTTVSLATLQATDPNVVTFCGTTDDWYMFVTAFRFRIGFNVANTNAMVVALIETLRIVHKQAGQFEYNYPGMPGAYIDLTGHVDAPAAPNPAGQTPLQTWCTLPRPLCVSRKDDTFNVIFGNWGGTAVPVVLELMGAVIPKSTWDEARCSELGAPGELESWLSPAPGARPGLLIPPAAPTPGARPRAQLPYDPQRLADMNDDDVDAAVVDMLLEQPGTLKRQLLAQGMGRR